MNLDASLACIFFGSVLAGAAAVLLFRPGRPEPMPSLDQARRWFVLILGVSAIVAGVVGMIANVA